LPKAKLLQRIKMFDSPASIQFTFTKACIISGR